MSTDNLQIKFTLDGSPTLYRADIDEHYHSTKGALAESRHVFIDCGLLHRLNQPHNDFLSIVEVGLGTGLNAALTAIEAQRRRQHVDYFAFEPFPPSEELIAAIHYDAMIDDIMLRINRAPWEATVQINDFMRFTKTRSPFPHTNMPSADVVYFDAFSPERQSDMWTAEGFCKIHEVMNPGGVLTTYCAKGAVRRTLQSVGLTTERLQGPLGGKREILRATKL